jgi:hypothetical protein
MKSTYLKALPIVLILCCVLGCEYESEEAFLEEQNQQNPDAVCRDDSVSFSENVLPIFEQHCYTCHSIENAPSRGNDNVLEGYENIKQYVDFDLIPGVIRHDPGFLPMPKDAPKLSPCKIETIEVWIAEGLKNN